VLRRALAVLTVILGTNPNVFGAADALTGSILRECPTDSTLDIDLAEFFQDTAINGTVVEITTNAPLADPVFFVELFDLSTPLTIENFLAYVMDGAYDGSFIHRSVSDFVIQGGGFKAPSVPADQPGSDPIAIDTKGTVPNEPGISNVRGTVAMAKLGGQPNSATSQWFVNLNDNLFLDTDNGGYTVFGEVLGAGMTVVDTLAAAPTNDATAYYANGVFSDLPLWKLNDDNIVLPEDFVRIETIREGEALTFSYSFDSNVLAANISGSVLSINCAETRPPKTVVVQATSKLDNSTADLEISLTAPSLDPAILWFITRPTHIEPDA